VRIVLAGAVHSSRVTLESLVRHRADVVLVLGYEPKDRALVSGYADLSACARANGVPYLGFQSVNHPSIVERVREARPDVLFVVGLSQLVSGELLAIPTRGSVGFHPTQLPKGRGRAPIAWIVLDGAPAAATLFELQEDSDSGAIFKQAPISISIDDDASIVEAKVLAALERALDAWLPSMLSGGWSSQAQDEAHATWYGRRTPEDGLIDWSVAAEPILKLVRAATRPHPGAFTFRGPDRLIAWKAQGDESGAHRGVAGRVLAVNAAGHALVQTGTTPLWLTDYEIVGAAGSRLKVGEKLGYHVELEINKLWRELGRLKNGGNA
jgi:methionyl-tRNA formyltransferase